MDEHRAGFPSPFALFTAVLAVSTASILIRFAQADASSMAIATLRLAFATLIVAPLAWTRHRAELISLSPKEILLGVLSGIFLAAHFATWISSLEYTTVASSVVFVSTAPLWVALLSPMLLNERLRRAAVFGLAVAMLGGSIIGLSEACTWEGALRCPQISQILQGRAMWGNILALIGAWTVSGYLLIGRKLRAKMTLIPYIFLVYSIAAIVSILVVFALEKNPFQFSAQTYQWIFLLAIFPQLVGHSTFNWLLKYLSATMVAVTTLAEPVGSTILAYFFLHETPSFAVIIGGIMILSGIYLSLTHGGTS